MKTKSGRVLSDTDLERLSARAEAGLDLSSWKPRRGRRSLAGTVGAHSPRITARISEELHHRATVRAAKEGRSISEVVRALLEGYATRGAK
jgi:Ribbon-helix-helix protein, copG family.